MALPQGKLVSGPDVLTSGQQACTGCTNKESRHQVRPCIVWRSAAGQSGNSRAGSMLCRVLRSWSYRGLGRRYGVDQVSQGIMARLTEYLAAGLSQGLAASEGLSYLNQVWQSALHCSRAQASVVCFTFCWSCHGCRHGMCLGFDRHCRGIADLCHAVAPSAKTLCFCSFVLSCPMPGGWYVALD